MYALKYTLIKTYISYKLLLRSLYFIQSSVSLLDDLNTEDQRQIDRKQYIVSSEKLKNTSKLILDELNKAKHKLKWKEKTEMTEMQIKQRKGSEDKV